MRKIPELVIGQTVEALEFAKKNNLHCMLCECPMKYFFFDSGLLERSTSLKFDLYLKGQIVNHTPVKKLIIEGNVVHYFDGYQEKKILCDRLYVYDFPSISCDGFIAQEELCFYRVIDWIKFSLIQPHEYMNIFVEDRTFCELHFYYSRIKETSKRKNGIVLSYLKEDEIEDPDLSMSMTNLRLKTLFKEHGFISKIRKRPSGRLDPIPCEFELTHREKIRTSLYKVQTPPNIIYKNSYIYEVVDERAETVLNDAILPSGWNNTNS